MKIGFTGDFFVNGRVEEEVKKETWQSLFSEIQPKFSENDFNIIDLESPITNSDATIKKTGPNLKMPIGSTQILKFLNCSLVATANNHFYDFGREGLLETFQNLKKTNIDWVGSGENPEEASKSKTLYKEGLKVGIINICENEWTTVSDNRSGCHGLDPVGNYYTIKEAIKTHDHVVLIYHGGHEHYPLPSPRIKQLFRYYVDLGVSAVVSHHTHVFSGFEVYKGAPIFYSLGNFCFDRSSERDSGWNYGLFLTLSFHSNKNVEFEYTFFEQNNLKPGVYLLRDEKLEIKRRELQSLNELIADDPLLLAEFDNYVKKQKSLFDFWIEPYPSKLFKVFSKRILPSFITKAKKRLFLNLIRCESHRDIFMGILKK